MSDIRQWLEQMGFGKYADAFEREEVDLDALPHLTSEILKDIGVPAGAGSGADSSIRTRSSTGSTTATRRTTSVSGSRYRRAPRSSAAGSPRSTS